MEAAGTEIRHAQALLAAQTGYRLSLDGVWGPQTEYVFSEASQSIQNEVRAMLARAGASPESISQVSRRQTIPIVKVSMSKLTGPARLIADRAALRGITGSSLANLLANIDVESKFKAVSEGHQYNDLSRARALFSGLRTYTDEAVRSLVKSGKTAFFEATYGYQTAKGRELGNVNPGDGGLFYGRGFIQTTGRSNYAAFDKAFPQYSVMLDPDVLTRNQEAAADAAVFFWERNVVGRGKAGDIRSASRAVNTQGVAMSERVASAERYLRLV